ncbi:Ribulose-phosphate 3-epimerase [Gimesia panareensis]|uniref:Ribulose-phosphate 3-epimerase n=1 Tax=Gimesia panareensis TaxID=2527978 RepID=A0A518FJR4_9PLAN|nr:ribulose-phosphate 3-epimerase [Gimesia panareensis]QDV16595.1 Ribulose-phosphate 3-epimerase [Gimesia panareensis]
MIDSNIKHKLLSDAPVIAPSMLKCDFGNLHREVELLDATQAPVLHWDVMDGHFVPNLSYGAMLIERVRPLTDAFFDAHLMISNPEQYVDDYIKAGCDSITVHIEALPEPQGLLDHLNQAGVLPGLAVSPQTPLEKIEPYLDSCGLVLVMSVEPGFGGQSFIKTSPEKIRQLKSMISADTILSVDGGIDTSTIGEAAQAGANYFVVGSAIFSQSDYSTAVSELARIARDQTASLT